MTTSASSTPRAKRVEFAEPLTSSPHRSYTNATTSNNVTETTPHTDTKDSAIVKDMAYCASDLLYALHEKTVDEILSDEASQHSSRFDDYSQIPDHIHTPGYSRSPDWSHGTQRQSPTTRQLSSRNWALGKRIIPYHGPDSDSGDDYTSESGSAVSSELGFESVAQSRPESKSKSSAEPAMLPPDSPEQHYLHADIESIDLLKSPSPSLSPEPGSYSTAREHMGSQDAYDDTSEFEFDSEWEEDYDQFPSVSRPQVRELGFALCTSDFMRKGIYPVKRSEKRAFVDYASQKAVEIGMTEDEFERMMRALRGVYLLQWGENKGNDSKVDPESGSKPDSDRGPERGLVSPKDPSAVTSENQQAASGRKSVESLPDANLADDQGEDVIAGTKQDESIPKDMEASVSESLQRLDFASADESGKGSATSLDKAGPASSNGKIMATPIDVDLAIASPTTSKSHKMGTEQIDQKERPSGKGLEEKSTKKLKMSVNDSSNGGKKRKQGESPLLSEDQPGNASHSEKSKRRKKTHSSSEGHTSSDRASTSSVQLNRDVQPQKKQSEKAAKEKATSSGKTKSLQSKQAYKLADDGIECVGQLTAEPKQNPRMADATEQLKQTIISANSMQSKNASESVISKKSTTQQPIQTARSSNSNQSSGTHRAGGSKVTARPAQARDSEKSGNTKKVDSAKGHSNNHDTAELIDLTKPEKGKHVNKAKDPNLHKPGTPAMTKGSNLAELEGHISNIQAQIRHQGLLKAKQAETRRGNPNKSPRLPKNGKAKGRSAKKSTRTEHSDFSTPMNRKVQPPAMSGFTAAVPSDLILSDCSELSDAPSDLPDSYPSTPPPASSSISPVTNVSAVSEPETSVDATTNIDNGPTLTPRPPRLSQAPKISRFFPQPLIDPSSCLPFQPISAPTFGLVQEQLAHDPFRLLIATIFLNRTRGHVALPVLFRVFDIYPSISAFATADPTELTELIRCLGFQHQRAKKCIALAQTWLARPPARGCRYRKLHYPNLNDGRDVRRDECLDDEDERVGWEIAHLPGVGAYSLDSWRIFCRDELRGVGRAMTTTGSGTVNEGADPNGNVSVGSGSAAGDTAEVVKFVPEWKKVLPQDKELRAYLTWMWLKEGYVWDWLTGKRTVAGEKVMRAAKKGGIAREVGDGNWMLETSPVKKAMNGFTMGG